MRRKQPSVSSSPSDGARSPSRRDALRLALAGAAAGGAAALGCNSSAEPKGPMTSTDRAVATPPGTRQPVLFLGHGNPMNAIEDTQWSRAWAALGGSLPSPRAILCISAHWYVRGTHLTDNRAPETIYDFSGFPRALYEVKYPAPGDPGLAAQIQKVLGSSATLRQDWGLDHGAWSVLVHLRPRADVPVLQLSIDRTVSPQAHLELGRALAPLRDQGVLILGSGNVTHNLAHAFRSGGSELPPWAANFDRDVAAAIEARDDAFLLRALETEDGRRAHPSAEHYLPLLYVVGAARGFERVEYPVTGFDMGSLSMRSISLA